MASDAYWNATKPNGMPDYVWQQQQAAKKKAEAEAKAKAEAAAKAAAKAKKAANKTSSNSNKGSTLNSSTFTDAASEAIKKAAEEAAKKAVSQSVTAGNYLFHDDIIPKEMVDGFKQYQTEKAVEDAIAYAESQKDKSGQGSVITGGTPIAGFGVAMDKAAQIAVDSGGKKDPITDAFVETLLGSDKMQENYKNAEEGSLTKDKADAALEKHSGGSGGGGSSAPSAPSGGHYDGANWSGGMSYKPYPTAEEMANYVSTVIQAAKGELGDVVKPEYMQAVTPTSPELRTLEDLASTYGITYDYDSIYKILNDSVEKQYDTIYQRQKQNEDKYYDNAVAAQNTLLDTLSRDRSNAVSAGVSKGMQAANALGAMLGVSQQFADNATALSQERSNTAKDYGASLAKAMVDAEATSNERKNAIMEIAKMLYGYDSEQYVANMDNYNTVLTNNAALQQAYMNNRTALQNALASIFGGVAANKITGDTNVQSSTLAAEAQKAAAQYAADQNYAANKYVADINKEIALLQHGALNNALAGNEAAPAGSESSTGTNTTAGKYADSSWLDLFGDSLSGKMTSEQVKESGSKAAEIGNKINSDLHSTGWVIQDMYRNLLDAFGIKNKSSWNGGLSFYK